jgi:hypothetical protein
MPPTACAGAPEPARRAPLPGPVFLALVALIASTALASTARAQSAAGVVRGHVVDSAGRALDGARVRVLGSDQASVVADDGGFQLRLAPGLYLLRVGRLGYRPRTVEVELAADTVDLAIALDVMPLELPEVVVAAAEERYAGKLAGFAERRRTSAAPPGTFFTRHDLERRQTVRLSDLLPRADLRCSARSMTIWFDGMLLGRGTHMDSFNVQEVEALEVYRSVSHLPPQFNMTLPAGSAAGCILLIWSR